METLISVHGDVFGFDLESFVFSLPPYGLPLLHMCTVPLNVRLFSVFDYVYCHAIVIRLRLDCSLMFLEPFCMSVPDVNAMHDLMELYYAHCDNLMI